MSQPREIVQNLWEAVNANDFDAAGALLHDDYVLDWPQSGERILGRANWIAVNANYPAVGPWRVTIHRIIAEWETVVSDVTVTDGANKARAITFSEIRDGKIYRQTEYWPDPFEPAPWRTQWVERIE